MSEAVSASEALGGEGQEAPAEGVQEGNAAESGGEQQGPWYGELDNDIKGWAENKGWKTPQDALRSAWNLEKLLGADKAGNALVMPKEDDTEGWNAFYDRLGRPESPDKYQFNLPEGDQESEIGGWFREQAHQLGLTQQQAAKLFEGFNERAAAMHQDQQTQTQAQQTADIAALKKEWGQAYEDNIMAGRKAARQFGFDGEKLSKLESALGTKDMLEMMANIGRSIGEHSFEGGNTPGGFGLTPAAAKQQVAELKGDEQFNKAYLDAQHPGHKGAVEKMKRLMEAAYPGGQ